VRALLDAGYEKPEDDSDTADEMSVEPYIDQDDDDDDDDDLPASRHRQVFALGRTPAHVKSTAKFPAAKANQPTKIRGTTVDIFFTFYFSGLKVFDILEFYAGWSDEIDH